MTHRIVFLALSTAALLATGGARADCKPLLDAMQKMAQQTRFAAFDVDGPEQPLGEPDTIVIGRIAYVRNGTKWERVDLGDSMREGAPHWSALRKELETGQVRCTGAGAGTYRGAPVAKYHYEDTKDKTDGRGTVWIDRRTGLPVYEGARDGSGGIAVQYGDAVKEPRIKP